MNSKVKNITMNGIGIALFVALSMCLQVPIFQNYYLCLGYVVMAVYIYFFGIKSGIIVGFFGTILYCFLINGLRGMPGWALGNIVIAAIMGLGFAKGKKANNIVAKYVMYVACVNAGCVGGILIVKSLVEQILYAQPAMVRMTVNFYAYIADVIVLLISIPVCNLLEPYVKKLGNNV